MDRRGFLELWLAKIPSDSMSGRATRGRSRPPTLFVLAGRGVSVSNWLPDEITTSDVLLALAALVATLAAAALIVFVLGLG